MAVYPQFWHHYIKFFAQEKNFPNSPKFRNDTCPLYPLPWPQCHCQRSDHGWDTCAHMVVKNPSGFDWAKPPQKTHLKYNPFFIPPVMNYFVMVKCLKVYIYEFPIFSICTSSGKYITVLILLTLNSKTHTLGFSKNQALTSTNYLLGLASFLKKVFRCWT